MKLYITIVLIIIVPLISIIFISFNRFRRRQKQNLHLNSNNFIKKINKLIEENKYNLLEERRKLKKTDPYGNENLDKWIGNPPLNEKEIRSNISKGASKFKEGIPYFWLNVIVKDFVSIESFFHGWYSYITVNPSIEDEIIGSIRKLNNYEWHLFIASIIEKKCLRLIEDSNSITNNNYKKGIDFEDKCFSRLSKKGWKIDRTPSSGDQGVDMIASIENLRICIQCKDHNKPIGNKAVQEIYAGKQYWNGTHAMLVSTSGYTNSATKLAIANNVYLISEVELDNIEKFIF